MDMGIICTERMARNLTKSRPKASILLQFDSRQPQTKTVVSLHQAFVRLKGEILGQISILSSAKRSAARIEGCRFAWIPRLAAPFDMACAALRPTQDATSR